MDRKVENQEHYEEQIAECARSFGNDRIALRSRQCPELEGVPYEKIEDAEAFIETRDLAFGGAGAKELHERFYVGMGSVKLPHKFKIADDLRWAAL